MPIDMDELSKIFSECKAISEAKNKDYGSGTLIKHGEVGVVIRMSDKMARLENLVCSEARPAVTTEKVEDTAMDIINYAAYLVLMRRGKLT